MNEDIWSEVSNYPIPDNEIERLNALYRYETMGVDPLPEDAFDRITELACTICEVPVGFLNLITADKQFPKACFGVHGEAQDRKTSVCQYTIMQEDIYEIEDMTKDLVFKHNPNTTGGLKIVYYAGAPLKTPDGYNIGTLCLIDFKPNKLNDSQRKSLRILANEIVAQFELKLAKNLLKKQNEEKDELIRAVSHDMRNPLTGIIGFSHMLKEDTKNIDHRQQLLAINEAGKSLLGIVNVLLNSSYIKNEPFNLHLEETDVAELTREIIRLVQPSLHLKKQPLSENLPESLHWLIDAEKWKQIVGNLLSNASKFTPEGKPIHIDLSKTAEESLILEITDSGIGIPEAILKNLFTGKKEILRKGTRNEPTTGVGMVAVKKFADLHNAIINVESESGKGTKFTLEFPS